LWCISFGVTVDIFLGHTLQHIFADIEKDLEIMSGGDLAGMARALQDEVSSAATQWAHTDATLEI